jgi:hypothetical protein
LNSRLPCLGRSCISFFLNCMGSISSVSVYSGSHNEVSLVYFSTFEPSFLAPHSIMQRAGVPMLYDSASNPRLPCLYICPVANVLGRAPLILCFIGCDSHFTIPYRFKDDRRIEHASAYTQRDRGNGSRLYEVNIWPRMWAIMWSYGRGRPRAAQREQDQGGRDGEASQRGCCRSGGGARRRSSGLNTGL